MWREEVSEEIRVGVEMAGDAIALGLELELKLFSVDEDIANVIARIRFE